jgi:AraC-like DNA-binding protein
MFPEKSVPIWIEENKKFMAVTRSRHSPEQRLQNMAFLKSEALTLAGRSGLHETGVRGLRVFRANEPRRAGLEIASPCLELILQGRKRLFFQDFDLAVEEDQCFCLGLDLPIDSEALPSSSNEPYMSIIYEVDDALLENIVLNAKPNVPQKGSAADLGPFVLVNDFMYFKLKIEIVLRLPLEIRSTDIRLPRKITNFFRVLWRSASGRVFFLTRHENVHVRNVAKVVLWMRENHLRTPAVADLAHMSNMSQSHFYHYFRQLTFHSPLDYLRKCRLCRARRLVLGGETSIYEISQAFGYSSAAYFSRDYRQLFGLSPKQEALRWRENNALC